MPSTDELFLVTLSHLEGGGDQQTFWQLVLPLDTWRVAERRFPLLHQVIHHFIAPRRRWRCLAGETAADAASRHLEGG